MKRRAILAAVPAVVLAPRAHAGAQVEEPLADSVRSALSAAIAQQAPPRVRIERIEDRLAYLRWLGELGERLKRRKPERQTRLEVLEPRWCWA